MSTLGCECDRGEPCGYHPKMDYAWEGMPLCEHKVQFDCDQCKFKPWLTDTTKKAAKIVHEELGNGHTENVYEAALEIELGIQGIYSIRRQVPCPITYKGRFVGNGILDLLLYDLFIIEIKAVAKLTSKDEVQVKKYLQSYGIEKGLLVNFGPELEIWEVLNDTTGEF